MAEKQFSKPLTRLDQWIISIGRIISIVFLFAAAIILLEIISRFVFDAPTIWVSETTVLLNCLLFLYGGIYVLARNKHIRITMIYDMLPPKIKRYTNIFITIMGIIYSSLMLIAAFIIMKSALFMPGAGFHLETSGSAWDPPFPAFEKTFLFIVFFIMLIQYILHLIYHIRGKKNV